MVDPRPEGVGPACGARTLVYTPREAGPGARPLFHAVWIITIPHNHHIHCLLYLRNMDGMKWYFTKPTVPNSQNRRKCNNNDCHQWHLHHITRLSVKFGKQYQSTYPTLSKSNIEEIPYKWLRSVNDWSEHSNATVCRKLAMKKAEDCTAQRYDGTESICDRL